MCAYVADTCWRFVRMLTKLVTAGGGVRMSVIYYTLKPLFECLGHHSSKTQTAKRLKTKLEQFGQLLRLGSNKKMESNNRREKTGNEETSCVVKNAETVVLLIMISIGRNCRSNCWTRDERKSCLPGM